MKTTAIRLDDDLHAQLSVIAQLRDSSIAEEIRQALERHVTEVRSDPTLTAKADSVLEDIEREMSGRRAAIATLFGEAEAPSPDASRRRGTRPASKEAAGGGGSSK